MNNTRQIINRFGGQSSLAAIFDNDYVRRIAGANAKVTGGKLTSVEAIRSDIRQFKNDNVS